MDSPSSLLPLFLQQLRGLQHIKTHGSACHSYVDETHVTDTCQGNLPVVADFGCQFQKQIIITTCKNKEKNKTANVAYVHSQSSIWNNHLRARPDLELSVFFFTH